MTPSRSSSGALARSSPTDPKPLMTSSPYNKGKEKQIAENPFREYMNMSVAIIEMNDLDKHPNFLAEKYLRDNLPPLNKPRLFYETLLIETKSVNIVHRHRGENTNTIAFSKIQILNVISLEEWGPSPERAKRFIHPEIRPYSYNFWDYKKAWEYVLCFQNQNYSHTWFIQFKLRALKELPNWFKSFFLIWGPTMEYLPPEIKESFQMKFCKWNKNHPDQRTLFMWFMIMYELPWILKWEYVISEDIDEEWTYIPNLVRSILIRWWDKFTRDHLVPVKITPAIIPSFDPVAAQPLATSPASLSVSQRLQMLIDQPGSSSSKEDLKKKVLEILDLDDESMASASATQPEDEVDPFANEDMLDHFHPDLHSDLYGGPK